ncbi:sugar transferase [Oceanobacter mangrovi]|uniref:sugar transferase n=1 Tax=Oceanobacter mangrovi TaxID=2862510 RepID=UPI001C8E934F|nr:sugar transferase [Oceanobacter mangrovi]
MKVPVVERLLALFLLILASPLFLCLYLMVWLTSGRPVFYVGERLGYQKKPFNIIKFRTLPLNAQQKIGGELFNHKHDQIRPAAQFMRDTRLDELPQLWNIARGDMQFIGPRPERYEVYVKQCKDIPNYEDRFRTAPGVVGFSQLCTPHSAPKTMRARIDRQYVTSASRSQLGFGLFAAWALLRRLVLGSVNYFWKEKIANQLIKGQQERRSQPRINTNGARVEIQSYDGSETLFSGQISDINHQYIRMSGHIDLDHDVRYKARMTSRPKKSLGGRSKVAYCYISVVRENTGRPSGEREYLVEYEPASPLNHYLIDQYFLHKSIIASPN